MKKTLKRHHYAAAKTIAGHAQMSTNEVVTEVCLVSCQRPQSLFWERHIVDRKPDKERCSVCSLNGVSWPVVPPPS